MALRQALQALNTAIQDLTSLHVQTYTGTVNLGVAPGDRFTRLEEHLNTAANSDVQLALETLIRFDGDSYTFVAEGASERLRQTHADAIAAGIQTRQGLLDLVTDWFD